MSEGYQCRECGIANIEPGWEVDGEPWCWADHDLCSRCQDILLKEQERDAARYHYLRNRQLRPVDVECGGVFAGQPANGRLLSGEDLDRAIDRELGLGIPPGETLESRLADCLADIVDTPLLEGRDEVGNHSSPLHIRLGFFKPELSNRAAELLEEAGR